MDIGFTNANMQIRYCSPWPTRAHDIPEAPRIGEWTTIDIINEELEPGKYTLTVIFGGRPVFREEQAGTFDLNTSTVSYGYGIQPGHIRNLSIMTK